MAYTNTASDRMDDLRFRNGQQSSRIDSMMGLVSPPRVNGNGSRLPPPSTLVNDGRTNLTRRFTTDSGRVPTLSSLAVQRAPATATAAVESQDFGPSTYHKVQLLEKKKLEYERLREQKRRFEAEMQLLDLQQRREEQELAQMQEDLSRNNGKPKPNAGHQSEPSTPPEYRETSSGFPTVFSRPNRYSTSSLTSPLGLYNRPSRSGSQLTSPQAGILTSRYAIDDKLPSRSVPGSRRNSDEDEKEEAIRQDPTSHRSTNHSNRFSMPVTKSKGLSDFTSLDQTNTTGFLFGDEEASDGPDKSYLQMGSEGDFPTLRNIPQNLSAASAAGHLTSSDTESNGWSGYNRHRAGQQSLPSNTLQQTSIGQNSSFSNNHGIMSPSTIEAPRPQSSYRNSLDMKYYDNQAQDSQLSSATSKQQVQATPPKLQSSFSANDIPTVKSTTSIGMAPLNATSNSHAQQHFHNHNASLGRIPVNAMNNRLSRDLSTESTGRDMQNAGNYQSISSALQASAPSFGPQLTATTSQAQSSQSIMSPTIPQYNGQQQSQQPQPQQQPPAFNYGYNMAMLSHGMQNMQMAQPVYNPYAYNGMYQQNGQIGGVRDSQQRVIQQRRQHDGEAMNKYANMALETLGGEIYILCKDQHGCRYLQKKLEERNPEHIHMIWLETNQHVIELMTDPFGNYLCQKLLEYCNDEERTILIQNAAQDLVRIALNQHGTRALQKMIEFISTESQISTIIEALRHQVVDLIQDLNGNHVIQKCLNKLSPVDAQFIFEAVGHNCVDVGTHRHGCCVLQRCIDHASGGQKAWLIRQISDNAITLVQDPFGNYVVQYILDLNEPVFTEPLVRMFSGRVGQLARQKFSSNVIEKCLRCASEPSKDLLIEELLNPNDILKILSDSFANYVVQTALEYASPQMRDRLVEAIRPHLAAIRSTPYGRRIQTKIAHSEGRSGSSSGQGTPGDNSNGQIPLRQAHQRALSNTSTNSYVPGNQFGGNFGANTSRGAPITFPTVTQVGAGQVSNNPQQHSSYVAQLSGGQANSAQPSSYPTQYGRSNGAPQPGFF